MSSYMHNMFASTSCALANANEPLFINIVSVSEFEFLAALAYVAS